MTYRMLVSSIAESTQVKSEIVDEILWIFSDYVPLLNFGRKINDDDFDVFLAFFQYPDDLINNILAGLCYCRIQKVENLRGSVKPEKADFLKAITLAKKIRLILLSIGDNG